MYIFDSVTKIKRKFIPQIEGEVTLYVCGPTVYDDAHLGHAKSALTFDLLCRVLKIQGLHVKYARNITDIDDKIINRAKELNVDIKNLTDKYINFYHQDMEKLGILRPDIEPRATQSLDEMIEMISKLLKNNHAYKISNGDIYFDIKSDKKYLSISHQKQDENKKQSRITSSKEKNSDADFALWKSVSAKDIGFNSPFGKGRPGWHLECSAMIEKYFVKNSTCKYAIDIHGGGADLLFPHHENEAAQTRCCTSHEIAAYWMHNGFININNQKMSKSLGNSFFIKDALKLYDGEILRFYLLSIHYRSNFNFSKDDLLASKKRLDRLYRLKKRVFGIKQNFISTKFQANLLNTLKDDLNISLALSLIDEMISDANELLDIKNKNIKIDIVSNLLYIEQILGFGIKNPFEYFQIGIDKDMKYKISKLIQQRTLAKKEKNFNLADILRDKILSLNINIMDTPKGTFWEKIE